MKFCDNLRRLRKEKEYSQEYLAEAMSVSRQTISKWENGTAMPDLKKLTELAALFHTDMDTLLGIEKTAQSDTEKDNTPAIDLTPYMEHTERLFIAMSENQKSASEKRYKTAVSVLSVCLCAIVILFTVTTSHLTSQINSLRSDFTAFANSDRTVVVEHENDSEAPYPADDVYMTILRRNEEKPWLVTVRFTYAPESYANDTAVTFELKSENEQAQVFEATHNNGAFTAEVEVDLIRKPLIYINVNDGKNTERAECEADLVAQYIFFNGGCFFDAEARNAWGQKKWTYIFRNMIAEEELSKVFFSAALCDTIEKAELVFCGDGEVLKRLPLTVTENTDKAYEGDYCCEIPSTVKLEAEKEYNDLSAYVEIADNQGVLYRMTSNGFGAMEGNSHTTIIFTVNGKPIQVTSEEY